MRFNTTRTDKTRLVPVLWLALLVTAAVPVSAQATFKWVDEKGVVHYSDKLPPEAVDRGNVLLNKQGVPLKKVEPALTPEQRRAIAEQEEQRRASSKQDEETMRRDRALMASYASEAEIDLARQRAIVTIDNALQSVNSYSEGLQKRKVDISARIAGYKGQNVPVVLERELESVSEEIDRQAEFAAAKRKEAVAVNARYDADKVRYREISAQRTAQQAAAGVPAANQNGATSARK
jgi:hypothetical protein